jgi:hypothetical protein
MKFRRPSCLAAIVALISLLFMQFAVAAYACPNLDGGHVVSAMEATSATASHGMPDCDGMDMEQPSLCQAHALTGNQSLDKPPVPQVSPFMATVWFAIPLRTEAETSGNTFRIVTSAFGLKRSTAPPLAIQHCCFRI